MIDVDDIVRITQVEHLYGHLLDGRDWDRLGEVFTEDAVFDLRRAELGGGTYGQAHRGLAAIRAAYEVSHHAWAHHCSNVYVYEDDGVVRVASKFFSPGPDGMMVAHYDDEAVRTPDGWRLSYRAAVSRPVSSDPAVRTSVLHR